MKKKKNVRLAVFLPICVLTLYLPMGEEAQAQLRRNGRHGRSTTSYRYQKAVYQETAKARTFDNAEEFVAHLTEACAKLKNAFRTPSRSDELAARQKLLDAANALEATLRRKPDREAANALRERLALGKLIVALQRQEGPDANVLGETFRIFLGNPGDFDGIDFDTFHAVRDAFRRLYRVHSARPDHAAAQFQKVCDEFPGKIKAYLDSAAAPEARDISEVLVWFDDLGHTFLPEAKDILALVRANLQQKNLCGSACAALVAAGFERTFDEDFDINDTVAGTRIQGRGHVNGCAFAELVPNNHFAQIRINLETQLHSDTVGRNGPVTIWTATEGTIQAAKSLLVGSSDVKLTPSSAKARLQSRTTGLRIDGCRVVQCIAKKQIAEKQPQAQAEARRRAEKRIRDRFDDEVVPRIDDVNVRFRDLLQKPLREINLLPKVWDFATTETALLTSLVLSDTFLPTTFSAAASEKPNSDLWVRIHQSAIANYGQRALAGKQFTQQELVDLILKQTGEIPEAARRDIDQGPWKIKFTDNAPLGVVFKDDTIRVTITINEYTSYEKKEGENPVYTAADIKPNASFSRTEDVDILIVFKIKRDDGKITLVLDEESPKASARKRAGGALTAITSVINSRLKKAELQKEFEMKPIALKNEWEGHTLTSDHAATPDNGWLDLGWKFD